MIVVRRFLGLFRNSPTYGRDQASLISGATIGFAALVLNLTVLLPLLPLMLGPEGFSTLTENIEFGQLLGLILLGGATAFATLLIPIRMSSVFMGPRIGRYFDQVVLSGITPLRFLIGKVTSQNLFLALILFLLLPWLILVLALGGLEWPVFLANLLLLWLYCIMLALATLWLSLYMNEVLAMLVILFCATVICWLQGAPIPYQPLVLSPIPALMHGIYSVSPTIPEEYSRSYFSVFASSAFGMSCVIGISLLAISVGPLYGIIRDNSTFGEVVRPGDSKRKRRFRLRPHIQRPSELAFFYENRSDVVRRFEGLLRWGTVFLGLLLTAGGSWTAFIRFVCAESQSLIASDPVGWASDSGGWICEPIVIVGHLIHGITMLVAILLFSHARNTTYLQMPLAFGWKSEVSKLDSLCFVLVLLLSSGAVIGFPSWFETNMFGSVSAEAISTSDHHPHISRTNFVTVAWKGTLVMNLAAVTAYLLQRLVCLSMWMKSVSLFFVSVLYGGLVCLIPVLLGFAIRAETEMQKYEFLYENAPRLTMVSPAMPLKKLYGETFRDFPPESELSIVPFYVVHGIIILICLFAIRRVGRQLRLLYLPAPTKEKS